MMIHFWKKNFGIKQHFSLYLVGQTQCTLRFSGLMITMVQVSKLYDEPLLKKTHFEPKTSLFIVFRVPKVYRFSGWWSQWHKFQSCISSTFWKKLWIKHFFFVFRGPILVHSEVFRCDDHNGTSFKAVWWSISEKNTFWVNISLFFVFRGPNLVHSEVFRSDDHNGTSFKAVWWSISEKNTFWAKTSLSLCI